MDWHQIFLKAAMVLLAVLAIILVSDKPLGDSNITDYIALLAACMAGVIGSKIRRN